jgi:hypothetical protein
MTGRPDSPSSHGTRATQVSPTPRRWPLGIGTTDVNGLNDRLAGPAKIDIATRAAGDRDAGILVLTETKLVSDTIANAILRHLLHNVNSRRGGEGRHARTWYARHALQEPGGATGGVMLLLDSRLSPYTPEPPETLGGHVLVQQIRLAGSRRLVVFGVYLPHDNAIAARVAAWTLKKVRRAIQAGNEVVVAGDLNCNGTTGPRVQFVVDLESAGLVDAAARAGNDEPT